MSLKQWNVLYVTVLTALLLRHIKNCHGLCTSEGFLPSLSDMLHAHSTTPTNGAMLNTTPRTIKRTEVLERTLDSLISQAQDEALRTQSTSTKSLTINKQRVEAQVTPKVSNGDFYRVFYRWIDGKRTRTSRARLPQELGALS